MNKTKCEQSLEDNASSSRPRSLTLIQTSAQDVGERESKKKIWIERQKNSWIERRKKSWIERQKESWIERRKDWEQLIS